MSERDQRGAGEPETAENEAARQPDESAACPATRSRRQIDGAALSVNQRAEMAALDLFTEYFVKNYPGPNTVIHDPRWHAPKIFRAALYALKVNTPPPDFLQEFERRCRIIGEAAAQLDAGYTDRARKTLAEGLP